MKILAFEHELASATAEQFRAWARAEAARVWELYQAQIIREMYFHADRDTAILLLECATVEEARAWLNTLPFVQHRLLAFDLIPLKPYPGLARLFDDAPELLDASE